MKLRQITTALGVTVAMLLLTTACAEDPPKAEPTATATTPTAIATGEPAPVKLEIAPGRIGAAKVGMTKVEASATGYFDTDIEIGDDVCKRVVPLNWKEQYDDQADVITNDDGTIVAMGVWKTLKTDKGIGIGSTLGDALAAYDNLSPAVEAGYGQTGVFFTTSEGWVGFLFDEEVADIGPSAKITFIEVTKDKRPDLMRDGC